MAIYLFDSGVDYLASVDILIKINVVYYFGRRYNRLAWIIFCYLFKSAKSAAENEMSTQPSIEVLT